MEEINDLMTMNSSPQTYLLLRINNVNPCDTTLLPHHQLIRERCTSWSHTLGRPSHISPLKQRFAKTHWGIRAFEH